MTDDDEYDNGEIYYFNLSYEERVILDEMVLRGYLTKRPDKNGVDIYRMTKEGTSHYTNIILKNTGRLN